MSVKPQDEFDRKAWLQEQDLTHLETIYLKILIYFDTRFRLVDYLEMMESLYYKANLQMPKSHTEQYNLDNKFWYWYPLYSLGLLTLLAYIVAAVSGALLGLYYAPSAEGDPSTAYSQMIFIMDELDFGLMLRSIHRWAAQFMVAAVFLHMLRVYFTGAYKEPRELNWVIGVILLILTIAFGYTGYLLPWNQLSMWAGQIGLEMALASPLIGEWLAQLMFGGFEVGQPALMRMYIVHVFLFPFIVTGLIIVHIGIVWMQGIAEPH